jgi:hypothetical protein
MQPAERFERDGAIHYHFGGEHNLRQIMNLFAHLRSVAASSRPLTFLLAVACGAVAIAQTPPIAIDDGIVGGGDGTNYRMYLVPQLGGASPGAATEFATSATLKSRMMGFVIDQANADIIALVRPATAGSLLQIWRIKVQGTLVVSETQLTTLPGTANHTWHSIHRDASGTILVATRQSQFATAFTVNRVAVTRGGALASTIPITNPQNYIISGIASKPTGEIVLGGRTGSASSASGVTLRVSQNGGTPVLEQQFTGYQVFTVETNSIGVVVASLTPGSIQQNFACGASTTLLNYNSNSSTTLFSDIQLTPDGTKFVLVGSGFFGLPVSQPGGFLRINATACGSYAPSTPTGFPHGLNQVAIRFASPNYGGGCPPASTGLLPKIQQIAPPIVGQPWQMRVIDAVPNSMAMLVAGRGDLSYAGSPLPQALSVLGGQPHCFLLSGAQFQFAAIPTSASGQATNNRALPNDPTLIGTKLYSQWLVFETTAGIPAYSTAGYVSTVQ